MEGDLQLPSTTLHRRAEQVVIVSLCSYAACASPVHTGHTKLRQVPSKFTGLSSILRSINSRLEEAIPL
jgi:hypothetical protein